MSENNNSENNTDNTDNTDNTEQSNENSEQEQLDIQMALPIRPTPTYSTVPQGQDRQQTIQYIPPIFTNNGETTNNGSQDIITQDMVTQDMVVVHQFGKSVKCISFIDIFFGFLHFLVSPYGFITFIFPFFGYKGAISYKKSLVDIYLGYQILYCFVNSLILINIIFNKNIELPENQSIKSASFFQSVTILLNIYFAKIIIHFSNYLKKITPQQRNLLLRLDFENTRGINL